MSDNAKPYDPKPLDTSGIHFMPEQEALLERLAENVHDQWAAARIAEGWTLGPGRNDARKEHPDLMPYDALPEGEKDYDRRTAGETLKAIMLLGYDLVPNPARIGAGVREALRRALLAELSGKQGARPISEIWKECSFWRSHEIGVELLLGLAKKALAQGEFWICGEVLAGGQARGIEITEALPIEEREEETFRQSLQAQHAFRMLEARWLAQTGAHRQAREILLSLLATGATDGETLGVLARTYKDAWYEADATRMSEGAENPDSPESAEATRKAHTALEAWHEACLNAFASAPDESYPGINAATSSLVAGDEDQAKAIATRVLDLCERDVAARGADAWNIPTIAEAHAVLGNREKARDFYRRGAANEQASLREVSTTRKQARLIAVKQCWGREAFDDCFRLPPVIIYAGHRLDAEDRLHPRFPPEKEAAIAEEIRNRLEQIRSQVQSRFPLIAYGSAAAGSDILFGEALAASGKVDLKLVLSSPARNFVATNVADSGQEWVSRSENLMSEAREVIETSRHQPVPHSLTYHYSEEVMVGLARMKADFLDLDLHPLAVWDGRPGDGPGGTADFVAFWSKREYKVDTISISCETKRGDQTPRPLRIPNPEAAFRHRREDQQVKAMLFADVKHFSRLTEEQVPLFVREFLGEASAIIARSSHRPAVLNTWGDALYLVFDTIEDAGMLALELRNALCPPPQGTADWQAHGLRPELTIRFALHAGPVFPVSDPIVRHLSFTGRHTTQTARLEPVTKPGEIFVTREFAALTHLQGIRGFTCVYLGKNDLAKGYGKNESLYRLVRRA